MNIAVLVGSLKKDSLSLRFARAFEQVKPAEMTFDIIRLNEFPFYNPDIEHDMPAVVADAKARVKAADGVLFVSPEYNRSIPAVLKNAIEWCTRPPRTNAFAGKPAMVAGASTGPLRTAPMQQHLKAVCLHLGMHVLPNPEIYVHAAADLFSETGEIRAPDTAEFLRMALEQFTTHVQRFS